MKNLINILKIKIVSILEYIHATIHSSMCTCVFVLCPCVCILLIGFLSVAVIYNPLFSHLFQCDLVVQILHCIQQQPQKNIDTYTRRHASTHTHTHTHAQTTIERGSTEMTPLLEPGATNDLAGLIYSRSTPSPPTTHPGKTHPTHAYTHTGMNTHSPTQAHLHMKTPRSSFTHNHTFKRTHTIMHAHTHTTV